MYAIGMLGSYFSQGVYAVAGPFQGAVDIIVVQQEDGSFKSSPWYVKCGDFQGVLTRREKIVDISVNGSPANFYMLLNNRGEAYFEKEVEDAMLALPSTSSSAEGSRQDKHREDVKSSNSEAVWKGSQAQIISSTDATGFRQEDSTTGAEGARQCSSIKENKDRADDSVSKSASEIQEPPNTGNAKVARPDGSIDHNKDQWGDSKSKSASEIQATQSSRDAKDAWQDSSTDQNTDRSNDSASSEIQEYQSTRDPKGARLGCSSGQNKAQSDDSVSKSASEFQESQSTRDARGSIDQNKARSEDSVSMSISDAQESQSTTEAKCARQDINIERNEDQADDALLESSSEVQEPQGTVNQSPESFSDQSESNLVHYCTGLSDAQDPEYVMRNAAGCSDTNQLTASHHTDVREAQDLEYVTRNAASSADSNQLTTSNQSLSLLADDTLGLPESANSGLDTKCTVLNVSNEDLVLAEADSILPKHLADEESPQGQWTFKVDPDVQTIEDEPLVKVDDEFIHTDVSSLEANGVVYGKLNPVITEDWFGLHKASGLESGHEVASIWDDFERSNDNTMDELIWNDFKIVTAEEENELHEALCTSPVIGVHIDADSLRPTETEENNHENLDSSVWVSDALVDDAPSDIAIATLEGSIPMQAKNGDPSKDGVASDKNVVSKVEKSLQPEQNKTPEIANIAVVPPQSRWAMWPLVRRSRTEKAPVPEATDSKQALLAATNIALESPLTAELLRKNGYFDLTRKPKLRSYVPTSAQIESLKLKDGANKVTFTFPRVLGRTQVDANIYLWKWKTRIVISDVDGTITKSDVLGQFMPLVGRDWSQTGVTRLFSAIKDNGYEVLFLSARAISQAYLTRQFLVNLKQDGETLPEGPVFISPDGIIPSLYREVVRRAPHEFKISCLEGIRRLFPNDVNPFYAGFGNRDTDEISYLKVGIPKGKIFIINPKGEVKVNRQVDTKSYTSIHALVDDMFPPLYSSEQEDFNTWNYWKLPIPDFVDELSSTSTKTKKSGPSKK